MVRILIHIVFQKIKSEGARREEARREVREARSEVFREKRQRRWRKGKREGR